MTKTLKFKCTLESDLVLSQTSSSEGNQKTLDFIPGNNFLGIVAGKIYKEGSPESLELFHSGKVRFGDAHPSVDGIRGLRVPASMYYPKLASASEECYIHHLTDHSNSDIKAKQLKQCREGFYAFGETTGKPVGTKKNFTIKSAYDSEVRRSKDGQMFGYESLPEGLVLYFEVESDMDETTNRLIVESLVGNKNIGRSRSAQYGLVNIKKEDYQEIESSEKTFTRDEKRYATVYADGRIIFLDENGEPTFRPTAKDLGFMGKDDRIDWSKSQIRTFQYSPWNGKRHSYDTDRCGIEKGSVFVVACEATPTESTYIGSYTNEGFGKVIYNPAFLDGDASGKASFTLAEKDDAPVLPKKEVLPDTPLFRYLKKQQEKAADTQSLYADVNEFVEKYGSRFKGKQFASQWGSIRNIAMVIPEETAIPTAINTFLNHGVAKSKWEEAGRKEALERFMEKTDNIRDRLINLASEMAKLCRKEENK